MNPFEIGRSGGLEILLVLLLAFLAIGPRRVIRAGKSLGRFKRRVQKAASQVTKTVSETKAGEGTKAPPRPRRSARS